jgi:hypothetical protein
VSEAVALRDFGAISQWVAEGTDMNRAYPVGADILRSFPVELTPFEAAISAGRSDVVSFLSDLNVHPNLRTWAI